MKVSVILCTYNRSESLAKALASLAQSKVPEPIQWEVLVVDNNSRDATRSVVEEFCRREPSRFRYLFELKQGKSHALNTGIWESQGTVLAFTDDDVTVEPTWLWNLVAPLEGSVWAGTGGRTLPDALFSVPGWLGPKDRFMLAPLALFDLGGNAIEMNEPPFGNNMAYRKEVFEKHGLFRMELGPQPGNEIRSEDTEFGRRLLLAGQRFRYEPRAVVYHAVPQDRLRKEYFLRWWVGKARAEVREFGVPTDTSSFVAGIPIYFFRRLVVWSLRWMFNIAPSRRFYCKCQTWCVIAKINECFRESRTRRVSARQKVAE